VRNAPSSSVVYTGPSGGNGTGQGAAAILDQHGDGLAYVQNMYAKRAEQKLLAAQEKRKKEADWTKLNRDMPDVWDVDSEAIRGDLNTYSDELIRLKTEGYDPMDIDSQAGKRAKEIDATLTKRTNTAKGNQEYFQTAKLAIDKDVDGKYDKAYAADWFKKYTDPKLTPEERADMRYNSTPFKVDISDEELVTDTVPEYTELEYEAYIDPKAHKEILLNKFIQDPELFDSKKREGETIEQTAQRLVDLGQKMFPKERKKRPVGGSGGGGNNQAEIDVVANPTYDSSVSTDSQGRINTVTFNYKNQVPKTIQLFDAGGNPVSAQALAVKKTPKGDAWVVVAQREVQEAVPYTPKEIEEIDNAKLIDPTYVPQPKVRTVMKTETFPIDNTEGKVGNQNYKTISGMIKQDFQTLLGNQGDAAAKPQGGKYLIKGTEYTLDELKGMGYTEEQVAKYKQ